MKMRCQFMRNYMEYNQINIYNLCKQFKMLKNRNYDIILYCNL
jgi:hypothetical protein